MKLTEQQKITGFIEVTIGFGCDICKKQHDGEDYPDSWYYFCHRHQAWEQDSVWFLICSPLCYFKQIEKSLNQIGGNSEFEVDGKTKDCAIHLLEFVKPLILKS